MVVSALLALIILSLMMVFNGTQTAFRAGITQTDVLESGRAVSDLIKSDLETMTPSLYPSNAFGPDPYNTTNNFNFCAAVRTFASPPSPLIQSLIASSQLRTNVLENFFILSSANVNGSPSWIGTGYVVNTNLPDGTLYPLYRFYMTTNVISGNPAQLFNSFYSNVVNSTFTANYWSHLVDGVVSLRVRAYDTNGIWMNDTYNAPNFRTNSTSTMWGETGFYMFSNMLPASVEVELGVFEDRTLQRAESIANVAAQTAYLSNHVGQVHVFRQRAWIRNVDPSAYHQ